MKPLLSPYATQKRVKKISPYLQGSVLDIGCGWAGLPGYLKADQTYVGIDLSQRAVDLARQKFPQHIFYRRDVNHDRLDLGEQRFDVVVMLAIVEHLKTPENVLAQLPEYLNPGGLLLITTPSPLGDVVHRIGSRLNLFYPENVVQHVKIFNANELRQLVQQCGFEVVSFQSFLWKLNQFLVCRKPSG